FPGFGLHAFNIIAQQTPSGICPVSIDNRKSLVRFSIGGVFVHLIGPKVFGLLTILAALVLSVRIVLFECHVPNIAYKEVVFFSSSFYVDDIEMVGRLKWMPLLMLVAKLCPLAIECTFLALLMSIDNIGLLSSSLGGGFGNRRHIFCLVDVH
ncbi:hypothetical protein Golob_005897, partial [Gossypium lobatum]|nr:hypothetical protein [Gossypium lobatum]